MTSPIVPICVFCVCGEAPHANVAFRVTNRFNRLTKTHTSSVLRSGNLRPDDDGEERKKNRSITPGEGKTNKPRSMLLDTWNSMANLSSERSERESFQE
jgi:hypothetical protein